MYAIVIQQLIDQLREANKMDMSETPTIKGMIHFRNKLSELGHYHNIGEDFTNRILERISIDLPSSLDDETMLLAIALLDEMAILTIKAYKVIVPEFGVEVFLNMLKNSDIKVG